MADLPLSKAIASLRSELKAAVVDSDPELPLTVRELELELTLEAGDESGAEVGANLWTVVTGKLHAKESSSRLHRLRIVLAPQTLDPEGNPQQANLSSGF